MYIPPGFNTVTPYYFVKDAESFVALSGGFPSELLKNHTPREPGGPLSSTVRPQSSEEDEARRFRIIIY